MAYRPVDNQLFRRSFQAAYKVMNDLMIPAINNNERVPEQLQLFPGLCFNRTKILIMGITDICDHPYVGINYISQSVHFPGK